MSTDRPGETVAFTSAVFPRISGRAGDLEREAESARVRGYAAGHAAGMRVSAEAARLLREQAERERGQDRLAGERRIAQALVAVDAAVASLTEREVELAEAGQRTLERLAIELAEAIVARELSEGEGSAAAALRRALSRVEPAEVRELRLNPADLETLRHAGAAADGLRLVADASLAPGDAVAGLVEGAVDARIGAAFERARRALGAASAGGGA